MAEDFAAFFASTCPGMIAKAILLSGHRQEAEDAVQEAYTEALRSWHRIGAYDSPEAWVYKVMRQRLWAAARRASRQVPSGVELRVPGGSLADPVRTAEARAVIAALAGLPGKMRFVVVMHCLNGMPQGDVAREHGLAVALSPCTCTRRAACWRRRLAWCRRARRSAARPGGCPGFGVPRAWSRG